MVVAVCWSAGGTGNGSHLCCFLSQYGVNEKVKELEIKDKERAALEKKVGG